MKEDTYVIQCFLNGERKLAHELTTEEAKNFDKVACHLRNYLYDNYLKPPKKVYKGELYNADPNCEHELDEKQFGGIKCKHCSGWFCY